MKLLPLFIISLTLIVSGCTGDKNDSVACRNTIVENFPKASFTCLPQHKYIFIVRDTNNAVYYVECLNLTDNKISAITQLFPPNK
jgi:hypothetical protein